jgi:V/A-type H+-transporting ATPase subunit E
MGIFSPGNFVFLHRNFLSETVMNDKIKELTDNIFKEGIEKARNEAQIILETAHNEAVSITTDAEQKAAALLQSAREEHVRLQESLRTEIKATTEQAIVVARQEIINAVAEKAAALTASEVVTDNVLLGNILLEVLRNWLHDGYNRQVELAVSPSLEPQLDAVLKSQIISALNGTVTVKPVPAMKAGFEVRSDNGCRISFSDDDLTAFFVALMKPKLKSWFS